MKLQLSPEELLDLYDALPLVPPDNGLGSGLRARVRKLIVSSLPSMPDPSKNEDKMSDLDRLRQWEERQRKILKGREEAVIQTDQMVHDHINKPLTLDPDNWTRLSVEQPPDLVLPYVAPGGSRFDHREVQSKLNDDHDEVMRSISYPRRGPPRPQIPRPKREVKPWRA